LERKSGSKINFALQAIAKSIWNENQAGKSIWNENIAKSIWNENNRKINLERKAFAACKAAKGFVLW